MTAILGFINVLMDSELDEEQFDAATIVEQNGKHLLAIIDDILDLSKIDAGKLEIESISCSLGEILAEVVSLLVIRTREKNVQLDIEYDGPFPESIESDPTRLRQILLNLVGNAVKFTESGKVTLVARLSDAESDVPKIQIDVVDTGIGITGEQIATLFQPFQQADISTTREYHGSGLGLTICKRLAIDLGGDITVKSAFGEGSTFTLTVMAGSLDGVELLDGEQLLDGQRKTAFTTLEKRKQAHSCPSLNCRILLAEDYPANARLVSLILEDAGADVTSAENGRIAHDLAIAARDEGASFDVILMDMQMPVMDGYDATAMLRAAGYDGPIIAMTAQAMRGDRRNCLSAGCNEYISKPLDNDRLITMIASYAAQ